MGRATGFASYVLTDIKRLTIVRVSRVGHAAYLSAMRGGF